MRALAGSSLAGVALVATWGLAAAPARATDVRTCFLTGHPENKRLCVRAPAGTPSAVRVEAYTNTSGLRYRFTPLAGGDALGAAGACTAEPPAVTCPGGGLERLSLYGQALNDQYDASALPPESFRGGVPVYMDGGAGDDVLTGSAASDTLYGRAGNDRLNAGGGADHVYGDSGAGVITYTGAADVRGGSDEDVVSFAGATTSVAVTLGTFGGDGVYPVYGHIASDVEDIVGGEGNDNIVSTLNLANRFSGGGGNDFLNPGRGADVVSGDAGNDTINVRDGTRDQVDCGPGDDTAIVDRVDVTINCETASLVGLDDDRDGSPTPADCRDDNASIHPGARDIPQDGIDQDCNGRDAPFPSLGSRARAEFAGRRVVSLRVSPIRAGTRIEVRCLRRKCPFKHHVRRFRSARPAVQLAGWFKHRALRRRTLIETRVIAPEYLGFVRRDRIGRKAIKTTWRCLPPRRRSQAVGTLNPGMPSRARHGSGECG